MDEQNFNYKTVYWKEVCKEVKQINPELAEIIDQLNPGKNHPLIKVNYRFGDLIVKNGLAYLPHSHHSHHSLKPITDPQLPSKLKEQLSYASIPLFLVLENASEVFIESSSRAIPLNIFYPGSLLGLFESLDYLFNRQSFPSWNVSAGARNVFALPKLNEESGFKRLKIAYPIDSHIKPRYLSDHWRLFSHIAQHKNFNQPWKNSVLFFTKDWLTNHLKDFKWLIFKDYIFKHAWQQAQFTISRISLNLLWGHMSQAILERNLKPSSYLIDHIKHIMMIASGRLSGFKIADNTDRIAPVKGLQQAIIDIYRLKKFFPTIMHICNLEKEVNLPVYYSLSYPTLIEGLAFNGSSSSTLMIDLRAIKQIIDTIKPLFYKLENRIFSHAQFDYFHVEQDKYKEIYDSKELLSFDKDTLLNFNQFSEKEFCTTSQFWRGCIRIYNPKNTPLY